MSRKETEKSDVQIGIFSGKSADYNLAILETLFQRQGTAWKIATALQNRANLSEERDANFYRTQKIYSVIQRKSGRLADLKTKGYLKETNGKWGLTRKGLIALSVKKPDLVATGLHAIRDTYATIFKGYVGSMPNEIIREPLGIQINLSKLKPLLEKIDPMIMLKRILEESRTLLSEGIELDIIGEEDLLDIIMVRIGRKRLVSQQE